MDFGFLNSGAQPLEVDSSVTLAISNKHPRLVVQFCSIGLPQPRSLNVILAHLQHWSSNRNNSNERNSFLSRKVTCINSAHNLLILIQSVGHKEQQGRQENSLWPSLYESMPLSSHTMLSKSYPLLPSSVNANLFPYYPPGGRHNSHLLMIYKQLFISSHVVPIYTI